LPAGWTICGSGIAGFSWYSIARRPEPALRTPGVVRIRRDGRVLSVLSSAGAAGILDEVRTLGPLSTEVIPVTLKEIFLETVKAED
jgi:hypothetical protein